jgi:hypothetical protein
MGKNLIPEHRNIPRCSPRPPAEHHTITIKVWRLSGNFLAAIFVVSLIGAISHRLKALVSSWLFLTLVRFDRGRG